LIRVGSVRAVLIWLGVALAVTVPIAVAAASPLLQWRDPIYIAACFAGIVALALVFAQPLLAGGYLPGVSIRKGRRVHSFVGVLLVSAVLVHLVGLWITSPPDVVDALLFRSPTPFSVWGVLAMWAVFAAAILAALRLRLQLSPRIWRLGHTGLALVTVIGSVVHALLIEGTMGTGSKVLLCALVLAATLKVVLDLRSWTLLTRARR
jgi:predicted ferric reductase